MARREKLLQGIDLRTAQGLEIGALCWPVLTRADTDIRYLDHLPTEALKRKYANDPLVDIDNIVAVDYVCDGISLGEAVGRENYFDFVIASHVIEHVPDAIGWLNDIHRILKPGGRLCLAIPDMRRTFDRFRQPTTTGVLIEDYLLRRVRPSPRAVFDHAAHHAPLGNDSCPPNFTFPLNEALGLARDALEHYHDVHCLAVTPASFLHLLDDLFHLELLGYRIAAMDDSGAGENEFLVQLARIDGTPGEIRKAALESLQETYARMGYTSFREKTPVPLKEPSSLDAQVMRLAEELESLRTSRSWRLTRPLRFAGFCLRSMLKALKIP